MKKIKRLKEIIEQAGNFLRVDLWKTDLIESRTIFAILLKPLQIILLTINGFNKDKCYLMASALTFWSLLSIVPVAALAFGIASGFGFQKMLEQLLLEKMPGQQEIILQVVNFSHSLLEKTKGGLIAGAGVLFLFWSVIKILGNIEDSFNDIWKLSKSRTLVRKIGDYLALMIICPFIFIVSSSVNFFITTTIKRFTEQNHLPDFFSPIMFFSLKLFPYILIWTLFTFIYIIMPNTKVKFTSGLLGGIVAGTAYQLIQWGYISFQVGVSGYNTIYGSFAALPMFLLWLQISWLIVLVGTELSFSYQNIEKYALKEDVDKTSVTFKRLLTLKIMHLLIHFFYQGKQALTEAEISKALELPENFVAPILGELVDCRLVSCVRRDNDESASFQPALDINKLSIYYILNALDKHGTDVIPLKKDPSLEALSKSLKTMELAVKKSNANILLKDLQYHGNQTTA